MSETKIKICGLTRVQDIEYVNEALPDYIGFVFAESRRKIIPDTALQLKNLLNPEIKAVGVFVNESINIISDICNTGIIDIVQLHGDEDEKYISSLRKYIDKPVIKALRVKGSDSLEKAEHLDCDFLLLDSFSAKDYGGTGKSFDWNLVKEISKPFFLAGGICSENAKAALLNLKPYCLDASSGVETNGFKDKNKILDLVNTVRSVK
jgi:phosphoribosylanthranilate isomerase